MGPKPQSPCRVDLLRSGEATVHFCVTGSDAHSFTIPVPVAHLNAAVASLRLSSSRLGARPSYTLPAPLEDLRDAFAVTRLLPLHVGHELVVEPLHAAPPGGRSAEPTLRGVLEGFRHNVTEDERNSGNADAQDDVYVLFVRTRDHSLVQRVVDLRSDAQQLRFIGGGGGASAYPVAVAIPSAAPDGVVQLRVDAGSDVNDKGEVRVSYSTGDLEGPIFNFQYALDCASAVPADGEAIELMAPCSVQVANRLPFALHEVEIRLFDREIRGYTGKRMNYEVSEPSMPSRPSASGRRSSLGSSSSSSSSSSSNDSDKDDDSDCGDRGDSIHGGVDDCYEAFETHWAEEDIRTRHDGLNLVLPKMTLQPREVQTKPLSDVTVTVRRVLRAVEGRYTDVQDCLHIWSKSQSVIEAGLWHVVFAANGRSKDFELEELFPACHHAPQLPTDFCAKMCKGKWTKCLGERVVDIRADKIFTQAEWIREMTFSVRNTAPEGRMLAVEVDKSVKSALNVSIVAKVFDGEKAGKMDGGSEPDEKNEEEKMEMYVYFVKVDGKSSRTLAVMQNYLSEHKYEVGEKVPLALLNRLRLVRDSNNAMVDALKELRKNAREMKIVKWKSLMLRKELKNLKRGQAGAASDDDRGGNGNNGVDKVVQRTIKSGERRMGLMEGLDEVYEEKERKVKRREELLDKIQSLL